MTKTIQFILKIVIPFFIAFYLIVNALQEGGQTLRLIIGIVVGIWTIGNIVWYCIPHNKK